MRSSWAAVPEELAALGKLALPLTIAHLGQSLMGFTDTWVAGLAGTEVLAAVGLANNLFFAVSGFALGLMMGLDPLMSQALGAGAAGRARTLVWQGSYLAVVVGVCPSARSFWSRKRCRGSGCRRTRSVR